MPEICRFYGIIIRMYYDDHNPPHFHAQYGSDQATVAISTLAVIAGVATSRPRTWPNGQRTTGLNSILHGTRAKAPENPGQIDPLP